MALIMLNGVAYSTPLVEIQNNSSATSLDALKIPTGQTVESYLNNKIQDNSSATDLTNTKLPTGQTIESYATNKFMQKGVDRVTAGQSTSSGAPAIGDYATAEGRYNNASGKSSHCGGETCASTASFSFAHGNSAVARGTAASALGYYTDANSDYQTVVGKFSAADSSNTYGFIVGNGANYNNRSNAFTVDWSGNATASNYIRGKMLGLTTIQNSAVLNIDTINNENGYMIRMIVSSSGSLGTQPTSVFGGNSYLLIGFSAVNTSNSKLYHGVQIAIGFGSNKIAMRSCNYNSTGTGTWSSWATIT